MIVNNRSEYILILIELSQQTVPDIIPVIVGHEEGKYISKWEFFSYHFFVGFVFAAKYFRLTAPISNKNGEKTSDEIISRRKNVY